MEDFLKLASDRDRLRIGRGDDSSHPLTMSTNAAVSCLLPSLCDGPAVARAAGECRERLGSRPDLVLAFASSDHRPRLREILESLRIDARARRIIGASCEGTLGVGREHENASGLSLLFLSLPETDFEVCADADALRRSRFRDLDPTGFIVLANPLQSAPVLRALNTEFPAVPAIGGMISGGPDERDLFLFDENGLVKSPFLALGIRGGVRLEPLVAQSCRPIGEPLVITRSEKNVIQALAGKKPYAVLEDAFASLDESARLAAEGNIFAGLAVQDEVDDYGPGDFVIRNIVGTDLAGGKLVLASAPRVGQTLQFQVRDAASSRADLEKRCRAIVAGHGKPFAAMVCAGRGRGRKLYGEPDGDAGILAGELGPVPLAGFFGNGEFAPVAGRNFRHDQAIAGALLYPA